MLGVLTALIASADARIFSSLTKTTDKAIAEARLDALEWKDASPVSRADMLAYAQNHPRYAMLWSMHGVKVERLGGAMADWRSACFTDILLPEVAAILQPVKPIYFLISTYDEPSNNARDTCPPEITLLFPNVFSHPERVTAEEEKLLPFFSTCKIRGCHRDWLFPFGEVCTTEQALSRMPRPWNNRSETMFWRGGSSGFGDHDTNPRIRTVWQLRADPRNASFDVGISEFVQSMPRDSSVQSDFVPIEDWDSHKYILDIGGNSYSRRLSLVAQLRSAVILYNPFQDIFSRTLIHGTHVLRANVAGTNIADLMEGLRRDDTRARTMGTRLAVHFERNFNHQALLKWVVEYVRLYSESVSFKD